MKKTVRVLWLMNRKTLGKFEVPLLTSFRCEVFLPKSYPYDEGNLSAEISFQFDKTLTIPEDELNFLNTRDFYNTLDNETIEIINKRFDIAFVGFFPRQLSTLIRNFNGTVVMRPFGLSNGVTYTKVIQNTLGSFFFEEIEKRKNDFVFGEAYESLALIETEFLRKREVYLPLGLKDCYPHRDWRGGDKKILFVCPRINTSPYFKHIYNEFKKDFDSFNFVIGGAQPIRVKDSRVLGYVSNEEYKALMCNTDVMFYHSREKRHLHYHPLEAVKFGMPLIFMSGGMLDELGGKCLPGRCETIGEAKQKIQRILDGDKDFVDKVIHAQEVLLKEFTWEYCEKIWSTNFQAILKRAISQDRVDKKRKKIAVVLPEKYRGGTLDVSKILAKMMKLGSKNYGDQVEVVFCVLEGNQYTSDDFQDLEELGIEIRRFKWKIIDRKELEATWKIKGTELSFADGSYCIPDDGVNNLLDCDFWFITSDRIPNLLAPMKPYSIFVHDCLQRYVPEQFGAFYEKNLIENCRLASFVLANTPQTYEDIINFFGINSQNIAFVDHVVELNKHNLTYDLPKEKKYFIWTTNTGGHKNQVKTIKAVREYFEILGNEALDLYVTGVNTQLFDPQVKFNGKSELIEEVRTLIGSSQLLQKRVHFLGELPEKLYASYIKGAEFLLHNVIADNGTLTAIEAAYHGVPTLSSYYPQMEYLSKRYSLNVAFFSLDSTKSLTESLLQMTKNNSELKAKLPTRNSLDEFHWKNKANSFWYQIRNLI